MTKLTKYTRTLSAESFYLPQLAIFLSCTLYVYHNSMHGRPHVGARGSKCSPLDSGKSFILINLLPPGGARGEQIYFIIAYKKYNLCRVAVTCRVAVWNRLRNVEVRERVGVKEEMSKRVDQKVLKWFGYVQRMGDERLTKKVYNSEVVGERAVRGHVLGG